MSLPNRGLLAFLALTPLAVVSARTAAAVEPGSSVQLPHGVHLGPHGRYYQDVCDHDSAFYCQSQRLLGPTYKPGDAILPLAGGTTTSPPAGTMAPTDVTSAYSLSGNSGGKVVAILDMPDTTAFSDLNVYRKQYGIPALPQCTGSPGAASAPCFAVADETGKLNPTGLEDGASADTETSLDMDMISAACPDCSILLIEFTAQGGPSDTDFTAGVQAAQQLGAIAASISWGGPETGSDPTGYTQPGKILVLAASGDSGYLQEGGDQVKSHKHGGGSSGGNSGETAGYPASAPDVLGVGGTNLQAGSTYSEVVWNDMSGATTSGCSSEFETPTFQTSFLGTTPKAFGTCAMRATNDISAAAEFTPASASANEGGIAEYDNGQGGWGAVVGTSAATPLVAAMLVRLGLALDVSNDLGFVYKNISAFNDVTSGTNDNDNICTNTVMCTAGAGWDGPTGVGTPNGAKLLALSGSTSSGSSSSSGGGGSTSGSSGGSSDDAGASSGGTSSGTSTSSSSGGGASGGSSGASSGSSGSSGTSSGSSGTSSGSSGTSSGSSGASGGGSNSSTGGSNSSTGGSNSSSGNSSGGFGTGDDAGTPAGGSSGGTSSGGTGEDAGGGNGFVGGNSGGGGCSAAPVGSSAPLEDSGIAGLLVGALVLARSRRRK
jgi:MYXO-CTERM domain-containing protein